MATLPQTAPMRQPPQYQGETVADASIRMLNYQRGLENALQQNTANNQNRLDERGLINAGALATGAQTQAGKTERTNIEGDTRRYESNNSLAGTQATVKGAITQEEIIAARVLADRALQEQGLGSRSRDQYRTSRENNQTQYASQDYKTLIEMISKNPGLVSSEQLRAIMNQIPIPEAPQYGPSVDEINLDAGRIANTNSAVKGQVEANTAGTYVDDYIDRGIPRGNPLVPILTAAADAQTAAKKVTPVAKVTNSLEAKGIDPKTNLPYTQRSSKEVSKADPNDLTQLYDLVGGTTVPEVTDPISPDSPVGQEQQVVEGINQGVAARQASDVIPQAPVTAPVPVPQPEVQQAPQPNAPYQPPQDAIGVADFTSNPSKEPAPPEIVGEVNRMISEQSGGNINFDIISPEDQVQMEMRPDGTIRVYQTTPEGLSAYYDIPLSADIPQ